jgi:hypothetical protein
VSLPSSASPIGQPTVKPGTDIYTVMLIMSFCAIFMACIILYIELSRFGNYPWWQTGAGGS